MQQDIKNAASAATRNETNLPKKIESKCENKDSISKWWVLKQLCKGTSVGLSCAGTPYLTPFLIGSFVYSLNKDLANNTHRKKGGNPLSATSSLWDDAIGFFM